MSRLAALVLVVTGCTSQRAPIATTPRAAYEASIRDAAVAEASEVMDLRTLAGPTVALVIWSDWDGYQRGTLTLGRDVFATAATELQDTCRSFGGDPAALDARVRQTLGLPPASPTDKPRNFVEVTAALADVFRPCADPDPTAPRCPAGFAESVSEAHRAWMAEQALRSYIVPDGYPWTRLGYTYDWSPAAKSHYGASEFVLRKGATVEVRAVTPTAAYCAPPR